MPLVRAQVRTLAVPAAVAAIVALVLAAGSCSSTQTPVTGGDFLAPSGLAVTAAGDRDLLFIASAGGDELRALNLCTTPTLPDGGQDPANTCPSREDFRFVPGPIRLFPASIAVGDRPVRLAGARLTAPDGGSIGAVLVGGADNILKIIDAANVVDAQNGVAKLKAPAAIDLISAPPADVIAVNAYSQTSPDVEVGSAVVRAYALTETAQGTPAHLVALRITAGPAGPQVAKVGRCALPADLDATGTLTNVVGTRLATIPRSGTLSPDGGLAVDAPFDTLLYVADGTPNGVVGKLGDGALEFDTTPAKQPALNTGADPLDTPGASVPLCIPTRRISARTAVPNPDGGAPLTQPQPLRSIALSPRFFAVDPGDAGVADGGAADAGADAGTPPPVRRDYAPGAVLLGATVDGKIAFVRTDLGGLAPLPPLVLQLGVAATPMEDLRVNGFAREVAFLKPPSRCLGGCDATLPPTLVQVGNPSTTIRSAQFGLVAVATSSDGYTYFFDGDKRRLLSDLRDALGASPYPYFTYLISNLGYLYIPSQISTQTGPTLSFPPPDITSGVQIPGGSCCVSSASNAVNGGSLNAGVTRSGRWRVVFHAPIPGLERRGGTLTRGANGKLHIEFPKGNASASFDNWTRASPPLLDTGDVFAAYAYSKPDGSPACAQLAAESHPADMALAHEFAITTLTPFSLDASEPAGFRIDDACLPAGITVEMRSAGGLNNAAWVVFEGAELRGRARNGTLFVAPGARADYPLDYAVGTPPSQYFPTPDKDVAVAFTITGPEPTSPQSLFTFSIQSGQLPTRVNDVAVSGAFAGPAIVYTSPKVTNLVFTAVTGANSVLQLDPAALQILNGVLVYR
jgi:hypothetical protein